MAQGKQGGGPFGEPPAAGLPGLRLRLGLGLSCAGGAAASSLSPTHSSYSPSPRTDFTELLRPRYRRPLAIGMGLMLFQQITGQPSVLYYAGGCCAVLCVLSAASNLGSAPPLYPRPNQPSPHRPSHQHHTSSLLLPPPPLAPTASVFQAAGFEGAGAATGASLILGVFKLVMTAVAVATVDSWGRRPLLLWGVSGIVASLLALGAAQVGWRVWRGAVVPWLIRGRCWIP